MVTCVRVHQQRARSSMRDSATARQRRTHRHDALCGALFHRGRVQHHQLARALKKGKRNHHRQVVQRQRQRLAQLWRVLLHGARVGRHRHLRAAESEQRRQRLR
jgi:hypothetical protein